MNRSTSVAIAFLCVAACANAQDIKPDALRQRLFTIAHDSMGGRDTGSRGNWLTAEYVAAEFKRLGLEPAGENGTYFQTIPFRHVFPDPAGRVQVGNVSLAVGPDILPRSISIDWNAEGVHALYAGLLNDATNWPAVDAAAGKIVVFTTPGNTAAPRGALNTAAQKFFAAGARGVALVALEQTPADIRAQVLQGGFTTAAAPASAPPIVLTVSAPAAKVLLGGDPAKIAPGTVGPALAGTIKIRRDELEYPARNVVGILRGSDPTLRNTYMTVTAHNDH